MDLTQREAAEALSISVRWYQRIENGEKLPSAMLLLKMIFLFNIDIGELKQELALLIPIT